MDSHGDNGEYYYNKTTGAVEQGRQSSWEHLLGPYDTFAEAARALDTVTERTKNWDDEDKAWRGED